MGFEYQPRQYKIVFADGDLEGLEVITGPVSFAEYNAVENDADIAALFVKKAVSWNLTIGGEPVPLSEDGIGSQDISFMREVLTKWWAELTGVSLPLRESSNGTRQSEEESLGLARLSQSP